MSVRLHRQNGFTLPELLVTCLLIGLLLFAALKVAHPQNFDAQRRNAVRWTAVAQQIQALSKYVAAKGELPNAITEESLEVGSDEDMANLCPVLAPEFADDLLYDPVYGAIETEGGCFAPDAIYATGITVAKTKDNTVTVSAPDAERGEKISLTRKF